MANFDKLALTAQRLIAANGRSVTIVKYGKASNDQDKAWRGQNEYHEAEVPGTAAFVPKTQLVTTSAENVDGVVRESEYALFAAEDDGGHDLRQFNVIEDGGEVWRIVHVELLQPADKKILYMFEVKR